MTADDIIERLRKIEAAKGDYELARGLEDDLHEAFIRWIAETGTEEQRAKARIVLRSKQIEFARYCA